MIKGIEKRIKRYVEVDARHNENGTVAPLAIKWRDGRTFEVVKILDRRRAASLKVGGTGVRYLVRLCEKSGDHGFETYLFYEDGKEQRFFVEEIVREAM